MFKSIYTDPPKKKSVLRRHPFITATALVGIALVVETAFVPKAEERKVDYTQPLYTDDYAMICPQSLLFDVRADHGPNAVLKAFDAFSGREEKARALGCEILQGGIPVTAHRMSAPMDDFFSITFPGGMLGQFFTMAGNLKNSDSAPPSSVQGSSSATPEYNSSETVSSSYERQRLDFQSKFPSLGRPNANLRWYPVPGDVSQTMLVTPYGPCVVLLGGGSNVSIISMHFDTNGSTLGGGLLGNVGSRSKAEEIAESSCLVWLTENHDSLAASHSIGQMWFTPEAESEGGGKVSPENPDAQDPIAPSDDPSQTSDNYKIGTQDFTWRIMPDRSEVLRGPAGPCATIEESPISSANELYLTLSDGSKHLYTSDRHAEAVQYATDYCRKLPRTPSNE